MKPGLIAILATLTLAPQIAVAQSAGVDEIIVTGTRREADDYSADIPAIGLRRTADFAIQEVAITGDSRDPITRHAEIYAMLENAIRASQGSSIQLAIGDYRVQALDLNNYKDLSLRNDDRPDSQRVRFLLKAPLVAGGNAQGAELKITAFIKSVKPVGRALMAPEGDLSFSVVNPDQYRGAIADIIAADAKAMAARLGEGYGVELEGLNRPVEWARSGLSDVLLYIPYKMIVRPKR